MARWLAGAFLTFALSACTAGFVYNRLDWLLALRLDSYLALDRKQEAWLAVRLAGHLDWHRSTQLSNYRAFLLSLRADVAEGRVDEDRCRAYRERAQGLYRTLAEALLPDSLELLQQLRDDQARRLLSRLEKEQAKREEQWALKNPDERRERWRDELEDLVGKLTPAQEQALDRHLAGSVDLESLDQVNARRRIEAMARLLSARQDRMTAQTLLAQLLVEPASLRTPAYQAAVTQELSRQDAYLAAFAQSLTQVQRKRLLRKIDGWISDVEGVMPPAVLVTAKSASGVREGESDYVARQRQRDAAQGHAEPVQLGQDEVAEQHQKSNYDQEAGLK